MDDKNNETLADIVAEMREYDNTPPPKRAWLDLADRIEAAWDDEVKAIATENAVLPAVCITTKPTGNTAALREACQKMLDLLMLRGDGKTRCVLTWDEFNESQKMLRVALSAPPEPPSNAAAMREALKAIERLATEPIDAAAYKILASIAFAVRAALAAPARNCDVGTAEEQTERFEAFCQSNMQFYRGMFGHDDEGRLDGWDCRKDCPIGRMIDDGKAVADHCQLAWAQMPYEEIGKGDESKEAETSEEEPMPVAGKCPGCGKEPRLIHPSFDGGTYVECSTVGCIGYGNQVETWAATDRKAVDRWNEFVKKVRDQHGQENPRGN